MASEARVDVLIHGGNRPSRDIAMKMRGCAIICTTIVDVSPARMPIFTSIGIIARDPQTRCLAQPRVHGRSSPPSARARQFCIRHQTDHHRRDDDVEDGADRQRPKDPDRHVALRIARLLRRVETASKPM